MSANHLPVSVIIPTYNRAGTVTLAIDSVLDQTYKHYEIIVVDDGSTDDTKQILQDRYGDAIRYIYQFNNGAAAARNTGIRASHNELIAFLDSDDRWLPKKLEVQTSLMSDTNIILSYTNLINRINGIDDDFFSQIGLHFDTEPAILEQPLKTLLRRGGCGIWTSAVMCRKSAVERVGCFDVRMRIYEDVRLWTRLAFEGKWAVSCKPLMLRIWSSPGEQLVNLQSQSYHRQSANLRLEIFMEAYAHAVNEPTDVQHKLREFIAADLAHQAKFFALDGEYKKARRRAFEALVFSPTREVLQKALVALLFPQLLPVIVKIIRRR